MTASPSFTSPLSTLADLLDYLGGIAPERVRLHPAPGTATEEDVLRTHDQEGRLCELVNGILVEKAIGFRESLLAATLIAILWDFVRSRNLGLVTAPDGIIRLASGLVRIPDVAFISWERLPHRRVPTTPIPVVVPDLAVEILSLSNTRQEMLQKCREYFTAGVGVVWLIDPEIRTLTVHTTPQHFTVLSVADTLEGGSVLPGFTLVLQQFFSELDRQGDTP